jgi:hypothetical protein
MYCRKMPKGMEYLAALGRMYEMLQMEIKVQEI